MIKAICEVTDGSYRSISVEGHADFGEYGRDLVCASVSSIMFGFMNALDALDMDIEIEQTDKRISVVDNSHEEVVQHYFELLIMQLKTIEESYGDFIRVERK